ncbi:hypothetical protein CYMTET_30706, partial [Cymbomonas tetramitiformis]
GDKRDTLETSGADSGAEEIPPPPYQEVMARGTEGEEAMVEAASSATEQKREARSSSRGRRNSSKGPQALQSDLNAIEDRGRELKQKKLELRRLMMLLGDQSPDFDAQFIHDTKLRTL